jgi:hypothetical protein
MLGSERRVKTAVILPKSVEKPLHQTCLLHLLQRPAHGYPRLGARPASISRHECFFQAVECGKCCDRFESVGITKLSRQDGRAPAPLPSVQFRNLSVVGGNKSVLNAVSSA